MNHESVTILTTWDNEIIEIPFDFEVWLNAKTTAKQKGEDGIYLKEQNRFLKFSNIKDERGKKKYLALEAPKQEYKEKTPEERKQIAETIEIAMKKTEEGRKKRFYERRQEILESLARTEKMFGMETTLDKLSEYNKLKIKNKC